MDIQKIINRKNKIDGVDLMKSIDDDFCRIVFFDPQYRGVLDKLSYGNEGKKRGKKRCSLQQMNDKTICEFLWQINRILAPSGYLFL
jgi:site-specific DNA-methyltransferase (adenine-specific)